MAETERGIYFIEEIGKNAYKIYERRDAAMYLVCGRERACLIDTAFGLNDLKALTGELTDLPVTVVNTHGHTDHVLGNHWFYGGGPGRVLMHPKDRPLYEEVVAGFADMLNDPWVKNAFGEFIRGADPSAVRFPAAEDILDGDVIDLGGKKLEVVGMPGHTAGSVMLLDREDGICYAGDSVIENLWLFLQESLPPETYLRSLRRAKGILEEAGIGRIYNGHFSCVPLTVPRMDGMIAGMEMIVRGAAEGEKFENAVGRGIRYTFGDWSVLCCEDTDLPV